ncbi:MAG: spore protease YyaC [Syntrophomonadaceae bacterium]|nr:spore protease YyaC [Syntrophomonadaceae bacterium]
MVFMNKALEPTRTRIHMDDPRGFAQMVNTFSHYIKQENNDWQRPTLVVCIGTDRSTGDSLGPLVGTRLQSFKTGLFEVYGTLDTPVHASNLAEVLSSIEKKHPSPFILAVDACLGRLESVGYISIAREPLRPGSGVNKHLPTVGDISISGIVNVGGYLEFMVLQNTRLSLVMKMAHLIANSLFYTLNRFAQPNYGYSSALQRPASGESSLQN